jgi:hypothetical protein
MHRRSVSSPLTEYFVSNNSIKIKSLYLYSRRYSQTKQAIPESIYANKHKIAKKNRKQVQ